MRGEYVKFGVFTKTAIESDAVQHRMLQCGYRWENGETYVLPRVYAKPEIHIWDNGSMTYSSSSWGNTHGIPMFTAPQFLKYYSRIANGTYDIPNVSAKEVTQSVVEVRSLYKRNIL